MKDNERSTNNNNRTEEGSSQISAMTLVQKRGSILSSNHKTSVIMGNPSFKASKKFPNHRMLGRFFIFLSFRRFLPTLFFDKCVQAYIEILSSKPDDSKQFENKQ